MEDQLNKEEGNSKQTKAMLSHLVNAIFHNRHSSNVPLSQCMLEQCNIWREELRLQQCKKAYVRIMMVINCNFLLQISENTWIPMQL